MATFNTTIRPAPPSARWSATYSSYPPSSRESLLKDTLNIGPCLSAAVMGNQGAKSPMIGEVDISKGAEGLPRLPPDPSPNQVEQNLPDLGNVLNKPITGAQEDPLVVGTPPPPSLEALQATRPGDEKGDGLEPGRYDMVRTAALTFGAQGGLAARSFPLNELLRRYQVQLDSAYDFHTLVLPVGSGQTLMRPPVVSAAQMAFALGDGGQVARETSCIYQITREAALASTPPNWRIYLVRVWAAPHRPNDGALPRTKQEVAYWNKWVAEGWGQGEKQAVEIVVPSAEPRPADYALTPEEWVTRFATKPDATFDDAAALRHLAPQLGPPWRGVENAQPHMRALFAVFALHLATRRAEAQLLLGELSNALDAAGDDAPEGPEAPLSLPGAAVAKVDAALRDFDVLTPAASVAARHEYAHTALMALLNQARLEAGVLAPAQFVWLKLVDRRLWYALHSLGFETDGFGRYLHPNPRIEAAGSRDHWAAERIAERPLLNPEIAQALKAVRKAARKIANTAQERT
jgi:defect-in-organelle-trafficking protein DotC